MLNFPLLLMINFFWRESGEGIISVAITILRNGEDHVANFFLKDLCDTLLSFQATVHLKRENERIWVYGEGMFLEDSDDALASDLRCHCVSMIDYRFRMRPILYN